ncbi:MAG TPA: hypothetical protein VGK74_10460 [Symbiobacteriaceae bacterium]|jgi:hypothetical protein
MLTLKEIQELQAMHPTTGYNLRPIVTTVAVTGGAGRDSEGGTIYPSGRFVVNAGGTDYWHSLVHAEGLDKDKSGAIFEADEDQGLVVVRPVLGAAIGIMPVRPLADGTVAIHLGGCFAEKPSLRPLGKRDVKVTIGSDSNGKPSLLIYLQIALPKRTTPRKAKNQSATDAKAATSTKSATDTKPTAEAKPVAEAKPATDPNLAADSKPAAEQ